MLNSINNNVNQIKVRVTTNDDTYADDFKEIEERILEIWRILFFSEAGSNGIDFKTICTGKIIILAAHFTRIITIIP